MNEFIETLKNRRSVRKYQADKSVPQELVDQIIEAGLYAASGMNRQPTIIVEVTDKEVRDQLSDLNRRIGGWKEGFDPFYGAPMMLIVFAEKENSNHVYTMAVWS